MNLKELEELEALLPNNSELKEETRIKKREHNGWNKNHNIAMAKKSNDLNFKSKMTDIANSRNDTYYESHTAGIQLREQDEDYKKRRADKNRKQTEDLKYLTNLRIGISNRFLDQKGYIVCPAGIFTTQSKAAEAMGVAVSTIQRKLKKLPGEYYYMCKEEYIMLTGKDL